MHLRIQKEMPVDKNKTGISFLICFIDYCFRARRLQFSAELYLQCLA